MKRLSSILAIFICLTSLYEVSGQRIPLGESPEFFKDSTDLDGEIYVPDTTIFDYFFLQHPDKKFIASDTTLGQFFQMYDPTRKGWRDYFNLGNLGSAAFPIVYQKRIQMGTDYGYHSYDVYRMHADRFRFYDVTRPLMDFYFTPVGGQQNFLINADFARPFTDGIQFSLNFNRINQEGFYASQDIKHTNFGMGVWYSSPNNKRDLYITFINSVQTEKHNGGVVNRESLFEPFARRRIGITTEINGADTRNQHRTFLVKHIHRFQDTLQQNTGIEVESSIDISSGYHKFSHGGASSFSGFYGPFLVETRGIRNFLDYTRFRTTHKIKGALQNGLAGTVGIDYAYHHLDMEGVEPRRNDLFITGETSLPLLKGIEVLADAQLGLGSATGDFFLSGMTDVSVGNKLGLQAQVKLYRNRHPLTAQYLYINRINMWENELPKPFGTVVKGSLQLPIFNAVLSAEQTIETNTLFFDEYSTPTINNGVYTTTLFDLFFDFSILNFHFENYLVSQFFSSNVYHLPNHYSKHQVYWESAFFKKNLNLRIGTEIRIIGSFPGLEFNPIFSEFYQGDRGHEGFLPMFDAFIAFKVQKFRFYVRMENLGDMTQQRVYYFVGNYPQFDQKIRMGISWRFFD